MTVASGWIILKEITARLVAGGYFFLLLKHDMIVTTSVAMDTRS